MGFESLEDALPLPQIIRTMKSITLPSHGRRLSVDNNGSNSTVDGSGQPSILTRGPEEGSRGAERREEICERSGTDRVWEEVNYLLNSLQRTKEKLSDGTDWDPDEVKWIQERYRLCKRQALDYILCLNLAKVLKKVSFPGERLTNLQVAQRVVVGCSEWELEKAIREIGLNPFERTYFRVQADVPPVEKLEQLLLGMMGDGEYVLAGEFNKELNLDPNSASYKAIKKDLLGAGWVWAQKKIKGKVVKVIKR